MDFVIYRHRAAISNRVRDRILRCGGRLRIGVLEDHRSLCVRFLLGALPLDQGGGEDAHVLDLRGNIPSFIHVSDGKLHDVQALDLLLPEPGAAAISSSTLIPNGWTCWTLLSGGEAGRRAGEHRLRLPQRARLR